MKYDVSIGGNHYQLELGRDASRWSCHLDGLEVDVDAIPVRPGVLSLRVGHEIYEVKCERKADHVQVWFRGECYAAEVRDPRSLRVRTRAADDHGPRKLTAPMSGKIVRVLIREGSEVDAGAGVVVVEAMKMQNEIKSPKKGTVQKILVNEGAAVNAGDVLAIVE
ncbi:MAG: acetyl-CoA carboxylase biotin carboxyl carrier protein subunit [Acidobacteria bacterium]|nr:MAG: acetyl-CoA carboxylase biotin carboxyl carrier protein subunit [Acidobacteriota bacterium]